MKSFVENVRDGSPLAPLHAACFAEAWSAETFDRLLAQPGVFARIACDQDNIVGFILVRAAADEAEILSLGVLTPTRCQGIGSTLMMAAAKAAAEAGAGKLFLEVGADNGPALALYLKLGFREVGRRRGYYGNGSVDGLTMRADLPLGGLGNQVEVD